MRVTPRRLLAWPAGSLRVPRATATWRARIALWVAPLALATASDSEPTAGVSVCEVGGVSVETFERSRLLQADRERLELVRGRALECRHPRTRQVLARLGNALAELHLAGFQDSLHPWLPRPVRVHVDPSLPARQAPLAGIEVHVTSREVLVTAGALGTLSAEVWRHELLHVLAARPPNVTPVARRLWLTLEEGVVQYLALGRPHAPGGPESAATSAFDSASVLPPPPLPALALLASAAYDPHPLARALARELERVEPHPALDSWLSCLAAVPSEPGDSLQESSARGDDATGGGSPRPGALAQVLRLFTSRCSTDLASSLSVVLDRWWGMPRPEPGPSGSFAPSLRLSEPG